MVAKHVTTAKTIMRNQFYTMKHKTYFYSLDHTQHDNVTHTFIHSNLFMSTSGTKLQFACIRHKYCTTRSLIRCYTHQTVVHKGPN